jgi:hypothetical protein
MQAIANPKPIQTTKRLRINISIGQNTRSRPQQVVWGSHFRALLPRPECGIGEKESLNSMTILEFTP